jgi:hypothetical protein
VNAFQVADSLYLVRQEVSVSKEIPVKVEVPTNHIFVEDCSGSMTWDLPKIREQLKKKLRTLLSEKDTLSIIWFSGRKEFGVLLEGEPVSTLADLKDVEKAIDRWLKPVGLTGFKEPLEEVPNLVDRLLKKRPGSVCSLLFMSDGCDNQWGRAEVLKAVEKASGKVASTTIVEYGYYADRNLLSAMAEKAGGNLIFAQDFDKYVPQFEAAMQKRPTGAPRIKVGIQGDPIGGFAFTVAGGDLTTYALEESGIHVPEDTQAVWYLSPSTVGTPKEALIDLSKAAAASNSKEAAIDAAYAATSLFAVRMKPEVVFPLLRALGDVKFIEKFSGCFGKQKYSEFMDAAKTAAFGTGRFESGWDPNKVPRDDAFTVLELLQLLAQDDSNRILMESPDFKYSAIGRGRVDASSVLTDEELDEIQKLTAQMTGEKDPSKIKTLNERIASITNSKQEALKFEAAPAPEGYPISNLTFNEDRPNVSVLVRKPGKVNISSRITEEWKGRLPDEIETHIFRNYAIIKDGLINVRTLPVRLSAETFKKLSVITAEGRLPEEAVSKVGPGDEALLYLDKLPVINRKMVKAVSAKSYFETQYSLLKAQADQKVYNSYVKELLPTKKAEGLAVKHGEGAAVFLKDLGITDGGFSPKTIQAEAKDFYLGKELTSSLKGFSKLPSLKEVKAMITKGKVNGPGSLMKPTVDAVETFIVSDMYAKAANKDKILELWLDGEAKASRTKARGLIYEIAQTTFTLVVGQVWFSEFSSLDENTLSITVDGQTIEGKVEMREIEIRI